MRFVGGIEPIGLYQKRVYICSTKTDEVIEMVWSSDMSDAYIRWRAPLIADKRRKQS